MGGNFGKLFGLFIGLLQALEFSGLNRPSTGGQQWLQNSGAV